VGSIRFSVATPPGPNVVEYAELAEDLGYDRYWLYDSAALYQDVWVWLARIADRTNIKLGTAVLVPNLRHVMTTASAIATIEHLAPGRLACGFGTGATATWVLGQPALTWAKTRRYVEQLRALLAGEVVEVDGARTQMIHYDDLAPARPMRVPLLLSALGPKGKQIARDVADGVMTIGGGVDDMDWHVQMTSGTVLDDGEDLDSPRVKDALGPWFTIAYHGAWQSNPAAVDNLPLGAEWRASLEAERPEGERHLAAHEGHASHVTPRDRKLVDEAGPLISMMGWAGTRDEIRARAEAAIEAGATEILYTPAGPDIPRELRAWSEALR
jgi:5,10-methylenetetrahydromethanopterin reductase